MAAVCRLTPQQHSNCLLFFLASLSTQLAIWPVVKIINPDGGKGASACRCVTIAAGHQQYQFTDIQLFSTDLLVALVALAGLK